MYAKIISATIVGLDATCVFVEVDLAGGLPGWQIVGLPETMIKESKDRVAAAIRNSGLELPTRKTTINLAPADIKKHGTAFDLPIAAGLLCANSAFTPESASGWMMAGELSLSGELNAIAGSVSLAVAAKKRKMKGLLVPAANYCEAKLVEGLDIVGAKNVAEVVAFFRDGTRPQHAQSQKVVHQNDDQPDYCEVIGQAHAKRAMEIAAAGGHHILLQGPPGTGKTMLAERLPSILPELEYDESIDVTKIYSLFGLLNRDSPLITTPPFRAPHHLASTAGFAGGGTGVPKPGEISLAHKGVLFMDELPEFRRDVLESLRQPLESGRVQVTRSGTSLTFPAQFMLVAAMNPCGCGYFRHPKRPCTCQVGQIQRYRKKISGPLLDRIDLQVTLSPMASEDFLNERVEESSSAIKERVLAARKIQAERYRGSKIKCNARLGPKKMRELGIIDGESALFLSRLVDKMRLSARAYDRIIKVARTIADLACDKRISTHHILEAAQYRSFDREIL